METIFAVDDVDFNLARIESILESHYNVFTFLSAEKMFDVLEKITPDLILLDIEMPNMDGFAALEKLKKEERTCSIPIIFLTSTTDENVEARAFKIGVIDFVTKPFSKPVLLSRIETHLNISKLIIKRTERIEILQNGVISVLSDMVENRDKTATGHVERIAKYTEILINAMLERDVYAKEMSIWNLKSVVYSVRLHDVGKIAIPDSILNKSGKLTEEEFDIIKTHPLEGNKIIDQIIGQTGDYRFLQNAKIFASYHHEWWNGTGYPYGLKEEDIPLKGRIMAVVDVYDALTSKRPYKEAFAHEKAVSIIMELSGKQLDPKILEVFFEINSKFKEVMLFNPPPATAKQA
ncbi:MAG: response regulator [Fibromonadaceae bacterium]|jgi:putative two-component system response regulator|nr:response regulator [Fibromonadaceae bacterium]